MSHRLTVAFSEFFIEIYPKKEQKLRNCELHFICLKNITIMKKKFKYLISYTYCLSIYHLAKLDTMFHIVTTLVRLLAFSHKHPPEHDTNHCLKGRH